MLVEETALRIELSPDADEVAGSDARAYWSATEVCVSGDDPSMPPRLLIPAPASTRHGA